jgi:hypothetical protein
MRRLPVGLGRPASQRPEQFQPHHRLQTRQSDFALWKGIRDSGRRSPHPYRRTWRPGCSYPHYEAANRLVPIPRRHVLPLDAEPAEDFGHGVDGCLDAADGGASVTNFR